MATILKCTWVGCEQDACRPQVARDGITWAHLCIDHDKQLKAATDPNGDIRRMLSSWVKAQGGHKEAAKRFA